MIDMVIDLNNERQWFKMCIKASTLIPQKNKIELIRYFNRDTWPGSRIIYEGEYKNDVYVSRYNFDTGFRWGLTGLSDVFQNADRKIWYEFGGSADRIIKQYNERYKN